VSRKEEAKRPMSLTGSVRATRAVAKCPVRLPGNEKEATRGLAGSLIL
jgi:hypothetical protein